MKKEDLVGKFHAHITIPESQVNDAVRVLNRCKVRYKITVIVLSSKDIGMRKRKQRDVMITTHYHTFRYINYMGVEGEVLKVSNALQSAGIPVLRIKIEHEDLPTLPPTINTYRECHIKIGFRYQNFNSVLSLLKMDRVLEDFRFSHNPHSSDSDFIYQFMNLRARSGKIEDFDSRVDASFLYLVGSYPTLKVSKPKIETTVVDTRISIDNWWA